MATPLYAGAFGVFYSGRYCSSCGLCCSRPYNAFSGCGQNDCCQPDCCGGCGYGYGHGHEGYGLTRPPFPVMPPPFFPGPMNFPTSKKWGCASCGHGGGSDWGGKKHCFWKKKGCCGGMGDYYGGEGMYADDGIVDGAMPHGIVNGPMNGTPVVSSQPGHVSQGPEVAQSTPGTATTRNTLEPPTPVSPDGSTVAPPLAPSSPSVGKPAMPAPAGTVKPIMYQAGYQPLASESAAPAMPAGYGMPSVPMYPSPWGYGYGYYPGYAPPMYYPGLTMPSWYQPGW